MYWNCDLVVLGTKIKRKTNSPGTSAPPTKQLAQSQTPKQGDTATATCMPPPRKTSGTGSDADAAMTSPTPRANVRAYRHDSSPPPFPAAAAAAGTDPAAGALTQSTPLSQSSAVLSEKLLKASFSASSRIPVHVTNIESINKFYIVPVQLFVYIEPLQ